MSTLSDTLVTDELVDEIIVILSNRLAPFSAMALEAKPGPLLVKEGALGGYLVEKSGTRPDVVTIDQETDTIDFQAESTPATNAAVTLNTKFHAAKAQLSYAQQLAGIPFRTRVPMMISQLAEQLWTDCQAIVTTAAYGAAGTATDGAYSATVADGALTADILQLAWGEATNITNGCAVITTRKNYALLLPDNLESFQMRDSGVGQSAFGLTGGIYYVDSMAGGDAETHTWILDKQGIAGAWGLPAEIPAVSGNAQLSETVIVEPETMCSFLLTEWVDTQTKSHWASLGVVAGFAVGDNTALLRISTDHA